LVIEGFGKQKKDARKLKNKKEKEKKNCVKLKKKKVKSRRNYLLESANISISHLHTH
jgi:hypothetical protein